MGRLKSGFALDIFDQRNAKSDRLPAFLAVYVQHFGPEHRTKTNELIDFLLAPPADRSITYFGLTYNEEACGFATLMYYPEGPLGIVDHLVLAPNVRGYGAFFSFCDLIASYLERRRIAFDHIAAEVMTSQQQTASTIKPMLLIRLMRMVGFRLARVPYWAPDPSIVVDRDACKAALLLASQPERDELPVEEFNRLVRIIYCVHYQEWYRRTMDLEEFRKYKIITDLTLEKIYKSVNSAKRVKLNGMKNLDLQFVMDPNPRFDLAKSFYIALIVLPATVGIAVSFKEERWVAVIATVTVGFLLAIFTIHPRLRASLLTFFRLSE